MAKSKKSVDESDNNIDNNDRNISKEIIKKFGKEAFLSGTNIIDNPHEVIRVSPKLDMVLGGGIPGGSVVTLAGIEKGGKSVSALHIAGKAQQKGRKIFYSNVEHRIKPRDIQGIKNLNADEVTFIQSYKGKILTAEDHLSIALDTLKNNQHCVLVIDSVSQLITEKECVASIGDSLRAPGAILLAQFCKKIATIVPVNDNIVIMIQHLIANTSGYGPTLVASGGRKIKYSSDIALICKSFKFLRTSGKDDDESIPPYGQEVLWQTTSTAFVAPGQKTTSIIRYGVGIDECSEYIALGMDFGFIQQSASWLELPNGSKIQGKEKLYQHFQTEDGKEDYNSLVKDVDNIIYQKA
jgi:RecA/RadA recombinase